MKISTQKPPNWPRLEEAFGVSWDSGVLVTYGDTVHTKDRKGVTPDLIVHELVHIGQQSRYITGPKAWWERYIHDNEFRLKSEMQAYGKQCAYIRVAYRNDQPKVERLFTHIWRSMSGMYGDMISYEEAKRALPIIQDTNRTLWDSK